jgi:hypothetical protein
MTGRSITLLALVSTALAPAARSQIAVSPLPSAASQADGRRLMAASGAARAAVHYGKWLTAASTAAFTLFAAQEHRRSRRDWDALLVICRSAEDACATGTDGRYLRADAEQLYQRSRAFDRRANRRLLGAQASLLATAALFLLDLRPGEGPENIPFSPIEVMVTPRGGGAELGMRIAF